MEKAGDLEGAIAKLRLATHAMKNGQTVYGVDVYTRLPLYLQKAGQGEEAMALLQELLDEYPFFWKGQLERGDNGGSFPTYIGISRGVIYSKMHLVLWRDNLLLKSLPYGILGDSYRHRVELRVIRVLEPDHQNQLNQRPSFDVMRELGKQEYMKRSQSYYDYQEYERLAKESKPDLELEKTLKRITKVLKAAKRNDLQTKLDKYATELITDTTKDDEMVLAEISALIQA